MYFLDVSSPAAHLLLIRNMLAMRNREINKKIAADLSQPHTFDVWGVLWICEERVMIDRHQLHPVQFHQLVRQAQLLSHVAIMCQHLLILHFYLE